MIFYDNVTLFWKLLAPCLSCTCSKMSAIYQN